MKKFVLILILFVAFSQANAQTYIPFPNPCYWRVDAWDYDPGPDACEGSYQYHCFTSSDTIINSKMYVKIMASPVIVSGSNPCFYAFFPYGYVGALRDDSIANKVFFIFPNQNTDSLLFDYNLNIGDTIKGILRTEYPTTAFVGSIDTVIISNQYHKRWNISQNFACPFYIIEGIGSQLGLIESSGCGAGVGSNLVCVKDSSTTIFIADSSSTNCQLINSIKTLKSEIERIKIIPNPAQSQITLEFDLTEIPIASIEIKNSLGQTVKTINNMAFSKNEIKIDINEFPKGLYFVQLRGENKIWSTKFVKG